MKRNLLFLVVLIIGFVTAAIAANPEIPDETNKADNLNDALIQAASSGSLSKVESLLNSGADPNGISGYHEATPLMIVSWYAGRKNSLEIAKLLLEKGADANKKDKYGRTAMTNVFDCHTEDCFKFVSLLKRYGGITPKRMAPTPDTAEASHINDALIKFNPPLGWQRFDNGENKIYSISFRPTQLFINNSISPTELTIEVRNSETEGSFFSFIKYRNKNPAPSRRYGKYKETSKKYSYFLNSKAYIIQGVDEYGRKFRTIEFYKNNRVVTINFADSVADYDNNLPLVEKCLETLKTPQITDDAIKADNVAEVEQAIREGAEVNAKNGNGFSPLMLAARFGSLKVAKLLINNGADVNAISSITSHEACHEGYDGYVTPLNIAAYAGSLEVSELLIDKGADVNGMLNEDWFAQWSPLMKAARSGSLEIAKLLLDKGADVNAKNWKNVTALSLAVLNSYKNNSVEVVKLLLEHGADVNITDSYFGTPLRYVFKCTHPNCLKIVELLRQSGAIEPEDLVNFIEVKKVNIDFKGKDEAEIQEALWQCVGSSNENKFHITQMAEFLLELERYKKELINKAAQQGLDSKSLERCLNKTERYKSLTLPVGAYFAKFDKDDVWIILYKWEMRRPEKGKNEVFSLGHVRLKAIRTKNLAEIGSVSCM